MRRQKIQKKKKKKKMNNGCKLKILVPMPTLALKYIEKFIELSRAVDRITFLSNYSISDRSNIIIFR